MRFCEIHDQSWFPKVLRDQITDDLQLVLEVTKIYRPIAHRLHIALDRAGTLRVLGLCSGAGGPWTKAAEIAKVARRDGQRFDCATWLHKAKELPKEAFKQEVERHLAGQETEPWEIIYFKVYKSQIPVIEQALETAGLMLGTDKSRGYSLEMICADFLAGANLENPSPTCRNRTDYRLDHKSEAEKA